MLETPEALAMIAERDRHRRAFERAKAYFDRDESVAAMTMRLWWTYPIAGLIGGGLGLFLKHMGV